VKEDKKKEKGEVSRRDFLVGAGAVVVGGAIGAGITYPLVKGDGGEVVTTTKVSTVTVPTTVTTTVGGAGQTVTTTVGGGATVTVPGGTKTVTTTVGGDGGAVPPALEPEETFIEHVDATLAIDVKNGKIVRGRPFHYDSKYPEIQPWTVTARGKTLTVPARSCPSPYEMSYRKRTTSPNRVLYPLKRVDWEPGGDPAKINPQNRGISKFKRISWDEASTIIASELTRVADTYGTEALSNAFYLGHDEGHVATGTHNTQMQLMQYWAHSKYGTPVTDCQYRMTSFAGQVLGGRYVTGWDFEPGNATYDVAANTQMLVGFACDVSVKAWRNAEGLMIGMFLQWYKDIGIKQIYISPDLTLTAGIFADKWIPVFNNTDAALQLAIAYTWIDEETYDQDYLDTHAIGFDKFKAYVMGDEDGVPKTPEWASELCGVTEWTIKALARAWASNITSVMHALGGAAMNRNPYGHEAYRLEWYLLAMQGFGDAGKHYLGMWFTFRPPGSATYMGVSSASANTNLGAAMPADLGVTLSGIDRDRPFLLVDEMYDNFYNQPVSWWYFADPFYKRTYPMEGKSEVHMIWATCASYSGSGPNGAKQLKAFRSPKLECYITQNIFLEDGMVYSDLILPICTQHELDDIGSSTDMCSKIFLQKKAVEPVGESKSDVAAVCEVAKKLDFLDKFTGGKEAEEIQAEWLKQGYENSGVADLISWEDLNSNLYFPQPSNPDWEEVPMPTLAFFNNPGSAPLPTPSGLLEFESSLLKDNFPDDKERLPVAHYVRGGPASEGWTHDEDRLLSERAKDYPLLICVNTQKFGEHSQHSDMPWTREINRVQGWDGYSYHPIWINPVDAAARGIEYGDIVRVFNERGSVLGGAKVAELMKPGCVHMDKAGGGDLISDDINRGGNTNFICPQGGASYHAAGEAPSGFLVEVEKVTGNQMDEWRKDYPEAFARDYDPAYGPFFSAWVEGGK